MARPISVTNMLAIVATLIDRAHILHNMHDCACFVLMHITGLLHVHVGKSRIAIWLIYTLDEGKGQQ